MTKQSTKTATAWAEAKTGYEAAVAKWQAIKLGAEPTDQQRAVLAAAEIAKLEAEDVLRAAELTHSQALLAEAVAAKDADALACDAASYLADHARLTQERETARAAYEAAARAVPERLIAARKAVDAINVRRIAKGEPALQTPFAKSDEREMLEALREPPRPKSHEETLARLRRAQRDRFVRIELESRKEKQQALDEQNAMDAFRERAKNTQAAAARENEKQRQEAQALLDENEKLANEARARLGL